MKHLNIISIRSYNEKDAPFLAEIFFNSVHHINSKYYSSEQINAWAPKSTLETKGWIQKWQKLPPLVATLNDKIVGFVEFKDNGHIDCFYCHFEYQGIGVGSALMKAIEDIAISKGIKKIFSEVSINAKAFFESRGFEVKKKQCVSTRGVSFTNFVMEKVIITK